MPIHSWTPRDSNGSKSSFTYWFEIPNCSHFLHMERVTSDTLNPHNPHKKQTPLGMVQCPNTQGPLQYKAIHSPWYSNGSQRSFPYSLLILSLFKNIRFFAIYFNPCMRIPTPWVSLFRVSPGVSDIKISDPPLNSTGRPRRFSSKKAPKQGIFDPLACNLK